MIRLGKRSVSKVFWIVCVSLLVCGAMERSVRAETLVTSLSSHRVAITSNYTGTSIVVFGAIEPDAQTVPRSGSYDIVLTVRGPRQMTVVREKQRAGIFWINNETQKFPAAPMYLGVLSSRPLEEIGSDALRKRQKIGLAAIVDAPDFTLSREGEDVPFRQALVRLKKEDDLYIELHRGVSFLTPTIFRAAVPLPAISPLGNYDIEIALFADGVVLTKQFSNFELVKTGFEQDVAAMAHERPLFYGLAVAAIALLFGGLANILFRRD